MGEGSFEERLGKAMDEALERKKSEAGWVSIGERFPEVGQMVLFHGAGFGGAYAYRFGKYDGTQFEIGALDQGEWFKQIGPITHWMPLPEPPKEKP